MSPAELQALKAQYRQGVNEVLEFANKVRWLLWGILISILAGAVVFTLLALEQQDLGEKNRRLTQSNLRLAKQNQRAIKVGCVLLDNAIRETGADQPPAQRELIGIAYRVIARVGTPAERRRIADLQRILGRRAATRPDCEQVATNPDSVKALP